MPRVLRGYITPGWEGGSAPHGSPGALVAAPGSREPSCFDLLALAQLPPERQPPERARLCAFYAGSCRAPQGRAACARLSEETCRARTRRCGELGGHAGVRVAGGTPFLALWGRRGAGAMALRLHPQSCTPMPRPWWISCAGLGTSSETSLTSPSSLAPCPSSWARSMGTSSPPASAGMPQVPSWSGPPCALLGSHWSPPCQWPGPQEPALAPPWGSPTPCSSCPLLVPTGLAVAEAQPSPTAEGPRRPHTR